MRKSIKIIALLLVVVLSASFVGCSSTKKPVDTTPVNQGEAEEGKGSTIPKVKEVDFGKKVTDPSLTPRIVINKAATALSTIESYSATITAKVGMDGVVSTNTIRALRENGAFYLKQSDPLLTDTTYIIVKAATLNKGADYQAFTMGFTGTTPENMSTGTVPSRYHVDRLYTTLISIYKNGTLSDASVNKTDNGYNVFIPFKDFWDTFCDSCGLALKTINNKKTISYITSKNNQSVILFVDENFVPTSIMIREFDLTTTGKTQITLAMEVKFKYSNIERFECPEQEIIFDTEFVKKVGVEPERGSGTVNNVDVPSEPIVATEEDVKITGYTSFNGVTTLSVTHQDKTTFGYSIQDNDIADTLKAIDEYYNSVRLDITYTEENGTRTITAYKFILRSDEQEIEGVTTIAELRERLGLRAIGEYTETLTFIEDKTTGLTAYSDGEESGTFRDLLFKDENEKEIGIVLREPSDSTFDIELIPNNQYVVVFTVKEGFLGHYEIYTYNISIPTEESSVIG